MYSIENKIYFIIEKIMKNASEKILFMVMQCSFM